MIESNDFPNQQGMHGAFPTDVLRRFFRRKLACTSVDFEVRGFSLGRPRSREHLERCAGGFMLGAIAQIDDANDIHEAIAHCDDDLRGFAYEGAAFTAASLDLMSARTTQYLAVLTSGPGLAFRHLINVGIGWSMEQLHLANHRLFRTTDPLLRWLAYDGKGFRRGFFAPTSIERALLRLGRATPRDRIIVQGIGRCLWFVEAGNIEAIGARAIRAPMSIRGDIWSGVGLACAYAGDSVTIDAPALSAEAGVWYPNLAQGVIFGGAARHTNGCIPDSTVFLLQDLLRLAPHAAATWADEEAAGLHTYGLGPEGFLKWQRRIQTRAKNSATRLAP